MISQKCISTCSIVCNFKISINMNMSEKKIKTEYAWRGVDVKYGNRGPELTKKSTAHTALNNEAKKDSTADNQPTPPLKDSNSTI